MKHKKLHTDSKNRKGQAQQADESAVFTESIELSIELENLEQLPTEWISSLELK